MYTHRNTIFFSVTLLLSILSITTADGPMWKNCGGGYARVPSYEQVAVFPNPIQVGQTLHVRAVVNLPDLQNQVMNGTLVMVLSYNGQPVTTIEGINLCNATNAIDCKTLKAGSNAISFDYYVPQIPVGEYTIRLKGPSESIVNDGGCLDLFVKVQDSTQDGKTFSSHLQAELAGSAQFSQPDFSQRQFGDLVQVGPIGYANPISAASFSWGTFVNVQGSQDVILPNTDLTGLVWGLSGNMTGLAWTNDWKATTYIGNFYLGYVKSYSQRVLTTLILDGTFHLTWNYTSTKSGTVTVLSGTLHFDEDSVLPSGWSNPLIYGRLQPFQVYTSTEGVLTVKASTVACTNGQVSCDSAALQTNESKKSLKTAEIAAAIVVPTGFIIILVVVVTMVMWLRRRRSFEEEDGIFSAARKPEYGNALVVDDIIQETREHSPELIPRLNRQPGDYSDDEYERPSRRSRRSMMRSTSMSRSRTPSRSDSLSPSRSRSRSASRSGDSYSDEDSYSGSSASRD